MKASKPPETSAVQAPWLRMVRTSSTAPLASVMRRSMILSITDVSRPLSSATRSRKAGSKAISPFIDRAVMRRDLRLDADFGRQLVDAFLVDHGGIHVGDQDLLAASLRLLHDDVDRARMTASAGAPLRLRTRWRRPAARRSQAMPSASQTVLLAPTDRAALCARSVERARLWGRKRAWRQSGMGKGGSLSGDGIDQGMRS